MDTFTPQSDSSTLPSVVHPRGGFRRLPALYAGVIVRRAALAWVLLHGALLALTVVGDLGDPFNPDTGAMLPTALLTAAVTGLDLRRRNLHRLLPTLGASFPGVLGAVAAGALLVEILYAVIVRSALS